MDYCQKPWIFDTFVRFQSTSHGYVIAWAANHQAKIFTQVLGLFHMATLLKKKQQQNNNDDCEYENTLTLRLLVQQYLSGDITVEKDFSHDLWWKNC